MVGGRVGFRTGFDDYAVLFWGTTEIKILHCWVCICIWVCVVVERALNT